MGINTEDLLLVNRGGESFKLMANDTDTNLDDDDLLWVQREGVDYHIRGAEIKEGIGPSQRPPDIGVFEVSPSEPGLSRFTDESFPLTMSVVTEGTPDPGIKTFKAAVSGTLKSSELSSSIIEISGPTEKISYSLRFQAGRYLYRDTYGGTGLLTFWYKSSKPGVDQDICNGVTVNAPDDKWYYSRRENITLGQIGGSFNGYLADIRFSSDVMSFHLDFADNSSDEAVGKDVSGNSLDWKLYGDNFGATNLFETAPITEIIPTDLNNGLTGELNKQVPKGEYLRKIVWDRYRGRYCGYSSTGSGTTGNTYYWYISDDGNTWEYVSEFYQSWRQGNEGSNHFTTYFGIDTTDAANGMMVLLHGNFGYSTNWSYEPTTHTYISEDGGVTWTNQGSVGYVPCGENILIRGNDILCDWWSGKSSNPTHFGIYWGKTTNKGSSWSMNQFYSPNNEGYNETGRHISGVSEDGYCWSAYFRGAPGLHNPQGWCGVTRGSGLGLGSTLPFCTNDQMRGTTCDNDLNVLLQTDVGLFYSTDNFSTYVRVGENLLPSNYARYSMLGHRSGYWWFADKDAECYWRVTDIEDESTWFQFFPAKYLNGNSTCSYNFRADGSGKMMLGYDNNVWYQTDNPPIVKFADSTNLDQYVGHQFRIKGKSNNLLGVAFAGTDPDTLTLSANLDLAYEVGDVLYRYTPFYAMSQTVDVPTPWGVTTGFGFSKRAEYTTLDPTENTGLDYGNLRSGKASGDLPSVKPGLGLWYYEVDGQPRLWDGQVLNFQDGPGNYNFGQLPFYNEVPAGYNLILAEWPYTLKLQDSVNIEAFEVGDYVTEYGGESSGYGTIDSIQFEGGRPVVTLTGGSGSWSLNSKMVSPPVFKDGVTLHCKLTPEGNVTALSESDYGWQPWTPTRTDFDPYQSNIIFPPLLSTGEAPDTDFPEGTELTVSVRVQNSVGEEIASKTVTPGGTELYYYTTKQAENQFDVIKESLTTFEERSAENEAVVLQQLEDAGLDSAEVAAVLKTKA